MRLCDVNVALSTLARVSANVLKAKASKAPTSAIKHIGNNIFSSIESEWEKMVMLIVQNLPNEALAQKRQKLLGSVNELRQLVSRIKSLMDATTTQEHNTSLFDTFVAATEGTARFLADQFVDATNYLLEPLSKAAQKCHADVQHVRNAQSAQDVLKTFAVATASIAAFAETVSLLKGAFPPIDSDFYSLLSESFAMLNECNANLAAEVNESIRVINAEIAKANQENRALDPNAQQIGPGVAKVCNGLLALITDVVDSVSLEAQAVSGTSTLSSYSKTLSTILHAEEMRLQLHSDDVENIRSNGVNSRLNQLSSEHNIKASPSIHALASTVDSVNVALSTISFNAAQYNQAALRSIIENVQPQMASYQKTLTSALDDEGKRLQDDMTYNADQVEMALTQLRSAASDKKAKTQLLTVANQFVESVAPTEKHLYEGLSSTDVARHCKDMQKQLLTLRDLVNNNAEFAQIEAAAHTLREFAKRIVAEKTKVLELAKKTCSDSLVQSRDDLVNSANKVLAEPGNDVLAEELYEACDYLEEVVDNILSKVVPLPKAVETVEDNGDREDGWKRLDEMQSKQDMESFSSLISTPVQEVVKTYATIRKSNNSVRAKLPIPSGSGSGNGSLNGTISSISSEGSSGSERRPLPEVFLGSVPEIVQDFEEAIKRSSEANTIPEFLKTPGESILIGKSGKDSVKGKSKSKTDLSTIGLEAGKQYKTDEASQVVVELGSFGEERVVSGTLDQLIVRLTDPEKIDMLFTNAFISTCVAFISPESLVEKFMERYRNPNDPRAFSIKERTCIILKKWIDEHLDVSSPSYPIVKEKLTLFVLSMDVSGGDFLQKMLQKALAKKETEVDMLKKKPRVINDAVKPKRSTPFKLLGFSSLLHSDSYDIACQLASVNSDLFKAIKLSELRKLAWMKPEKQTKSPNVLAMIRMFNLVAVWVAASILEQRKLKRRVKMMSKMVVIAEFLREMNDFQGTMSLLAGLSMASVRRLTWTYRLMSARHKKRLEELEEEMSAEKSYMRYRAALNASKGSVIPFLAVWLSDLAFIDEGNPDYFGDRVNFAKQYLVYDLLFAFEGYQRRAHYEIPSSNFNLLQSIGQANKSVSEQSMYQISLQIEPRNGKRTDIE